MMKPDSIKLREVEAKLDGVDPYYKIKFVIKSTVMLTANIATILLCLTIISAELYGIHRLDKWLDKTWLR